jgi:hypothetical protein
MPPYVKSCITDEQCYVWNGEPRRVNDLLGYPVSEDGRSKTCHQFAIKTRLFRSVLQCRKVRKS